MNWNDRTGALVTAARIHRWLATAAALAIAALMVAAPGAPAATTSGQTGPQPKHQLRLTFTFKVDGAGLVRRALAVSTPGSPLYGHYSPIAASSRLFGASAGARARVRAYFRAHGATSIRIDATGLFGRATMSAAQAEALFTTRPSTFPALDSGHFFADGPRVRVRVPRALEHDVGAILGFDTRPVFHGSVEVGPRPSAHTSAASQPSSEAPRTGTPTGCTAGVATGELNNDPATGAFTPNQYLSAYNYDLVHAFGLEGQGQRVALIEADGVNVSDVSAFASCFGFPVPPIHQFPVGGIRARPPGLEAILDTEILVAAAPRLSGIDVYETRPNLSDMLAAFTAPLQRPQSMPSVISTSLGLCEAQASAGLGLYGRQGLRTADLALAAAVVSGVTIVSASGDTGSAGCQTGSGLPADRLGVLYPASSGWSTSVGGTNLSLTPGNQLDDEWVWNDAGLHLGAGGGGFSALVNRPAAQKGFVRKNARAVPDVSMLADVVPGYAVYCTSPDCRHVGSRGWIRAGGTSASAPLFAGAVALIDQELSAQDRVPIGDLDSFLYVAAAHPAIGSIFNDVTRIGNDVGPFIPGSGGRPLGCCAASAGYDEASGLGSINMAAFEQNIELLAQFLPLDTLGRVAFSVPSRQHPVTSGTLLTRVTCSTSCRVLAEVLVEVGNSRPLHLLSRIYRLSSGGAQLIEFRFTRPQLQQLRAGLNKHQNILALGYGILTNSKGRFEKYSPPREFTITS